VNDVALAFGVATILFIVLFVRAATIGLPDRTVWVYVGALVVCFVVTCVTSIAASDANTNRKVQECLDNGGIPDRHSHGVDCYKTP
jgi:uncharacterized membrane protein